MNKVSIIVPIYNMEKWLPGCLDSLIGQTLTDIQIILIDDGSTDGSLDICRKYAAANPGISLIHKRNEGLSLTRNKGIAEADGEYVGFVDADDYVDPLMYERLYDVASKEDADVVISGLCYVYEDGLTVPKKTEHNVFRQCEIFDTVDGKKKLMLGTIGALPGEKYDSRYDFSACRSLYKLSVIRTNNIVFEPRFSEDVLFNIVFFRKCRKAIGIPEAYYHYITRCGSLTNSYRERLFSEWRQLLEDCYARVSDLITAEEYWLYAGRQLIGGARTAIMQEMAHQAAVNNSADVTNHKILEICGDEKLQSVLQTYPIMKLPPKQAMFALCMRHKLVRFIKALAKLRKLLPKR